MSKRVGKRLGQLNARRRELEFDPEAFGDRLELALQKALLELTGEPERDIVTVEGSHDSGAGFLFEGYGSDGTRRFWCVIYYTLESADLHLNIALTKGKQVASEDCFGQSGRDFGNRVMLARAFDTLLDTAVACGVRHLKNQPWDDRVRAIYTAMGFEDGEYLDLANSEHLRLAVEFIESVYDLASNEHDGFTPPW